jgi:hypothetical protein
VPTLKERYVSERSVDHRTLSEQLDGDQRAGFRVPLRGPGMTMT